MRRIPLATYRLQLGPSFGFADVGTIAPYLSRLGVTHAYLSPVLQAAPGSSHGYDVVDHSRASDDLGGEPAFRAMVAALHREGVGVVLDIVPNHMAAALPQNRWWWDVLENGPASFWAPFFDIDWDPPESVLRNRVLLPVLGRRYGRVLADGEFGVRYDGRSFTVSYFEHAFPIAPRSLDRLLSDASGEASSPELAFIASALGELPLASVTDRASVRRRHRDKGVLLDRVAELYSSHTGIAAAISAALDRLNADPVAMDVLLERQNYRLAFWRTASEQLDYRRFFDIDTLVALRVEEPEVFEETHAHVLSWVADGLVDGLRIDHIDGLGAPGRYLERLSESTGGIWVAVEKILAPGEAIPATWPVAGTTGYDFLNLLAKLFVDPAGEDPFTAFWAEITGVDTAPGAVIDEAKQLILDTSLAADLHRIVERVLRLTEQEPALRDVTRSEVHRALRALVVAFPVYRTYAAGSPAGTEDSKVIDRAVGAASDADPDVLAFVSDVIGGRGNPEPARLDAARMLEQLTGPVMAKGVEDTAFYRYHRFVMANEVGSEISEWATTPAAWHERMTGVTGGSMLATTTHDTKRSEDVRARLAVLSERPAEWMAAVTRWEEMTAAHRTGEWPDRATSYLLFQTLVGAWPLSAERVLEYAQKAAREAKVHTSWTDPDEAYEAALEGWVRGVLSDDAFVADLSAFVATVAGPGRVVALAQALCKFVAPGVADIYQGAELWTMTLVDPDNRRPVDFDVRERLLREIEVGIECGVASDAPDEGLPKLLVTARALDVRRRRPHCFVAGAGYVPIVSSGEASSHVVAFGRSAAGAGAPVEVVAIVPRLVVGLDAAGGWRSTQVAVPAGEWRDSLTGACWSSDGLLDAGAVLGAFPVALLELS